MNLMTELTSLPWNVFIFTINQNIHGPQLKQSVIVLTLLFNISHENIS